LKWSWALKTGAFAFDIFRFGGWSKDVRSPVHPARYLLLYCLRLLGQALQCHRLDREAF